MEKFKLQWLHEKPPIKERKPNLFYYDIRNQLRLLSIIDKSPTTLK